MLGLDGSGDDPLAVLKATAETLGCTVADDGTTKLAVRSDHMLHESLASSAAFNPGLEF